MDKLTLDERCAELKARMLSRRALDRGEASIARSNPGSALVRSRAAAHLEVKPPMPEIPSVEFRNPHPLIKAALSAKHTGPAEYGRLQFRWDGHVDIRVSPPLVRRALKILDTLFKLLEKKRLEIRVGTNEPGPYQRARKCTFATDRRERVEITIKEKTKQFPNPAWDEKNYSYTTPRYLYQSTGLLTLSLDEDNRSAHNWNDHTGHSVEEHLEEIASAIQKALQDKHLARLAAEENRKHEMEREKLRAEQQRQDREEADRVEQLKLWAKAWHECERLRTFVAEWERRTEANGEIQVGSTADAFRRWALLSIDRLDPLVAK